MSDDTEYNPRYLAFCMATGRNPSERGQMHKFQSYIMCNLVAFRDEYGIPQSRRLSEEEHEQFTDFLKCTAWSWEDGR